MTAKEYLEQALERIENTGWCQGVSVKLRGAEPVAYCLVGALNHLSPYADEEYHRAADALFNSIGSEGVIHWNDAEGRTKEEVLEKIREAVSLV